MLDSVNLEGSPHFRTQPDKYDGHSDDVDNVETGDDVPPHFEKSLSLFY